MNQIIKKNSIAFFGEECKNCSMRNVCLSPSRVLSDNRRFLLGLMGYKQKANKYMIAGTNAHLKLQKGIKQLHEYGVVNFKKDLIKGKEITLCEVGICSPLYGFRGYVDEMTLKMDLLKKKFYIKITDYKAGWDFKSYLMQLACYSIILSDINCLIYYKKKLKTKDKVKNIGFKLYPFKDRILDVDCFVLNWKTNKLSYFESIRNNQMTEKMRNMALGFRSKSKVKRKFMESGIYYLEETPQCKWCKQNSDFCSFWEICSKINHKEKAKQRYIGKKRLIVKTKPKLI